MYQEDTVLIPLRARDGSVRAHALVDVADAAWLNQWRWSLLRAGYAVRVEKRDGVARMIYMHRAILSLPYGDKTKGDHINRDKLDNRRLNLRPANHTVSGQNTGGWQTASSQYRGVAWHPHTGKWIARVTVNRQPKYLGVFESEEDAAEAARSARERMMPGAMD